MTVQSQRSRLHCHAVYNNAEIRCVRNANEHVSAVVVSMRRHSCRKKSIADSPMAPKVSTAIGVKSYSGDRLLYFDFASVATAPRPTTAPLRWLAASVSGQVKSHSKERPRSTAQWVTLSFVNTEV